MTGKFSLSSFARKLYSILGRAPADGPAIIEGTKTLVVKVQISKHGEISVDVDRLLVNPGYYVVLVGPTDFKIHLKTPLPQPPNHCHCDQDEPASDNASHKPVSDFCTKDGSISIFIPPDFTELEGLRSEFDKTLGREVAVLKYDVIVAGRCLDPVFIRPK